MSNVILRTINFNSLDEIDKSYNLMECSKDGSTSLIYKYSNDEVMKIFKKKPSQVHREILEDFLYHLNTKTFVNPKNFILIKYHIYGYIMDYCKGKMLSKLDDDTKLIDLFNSFSSVDKDIYDISKRRIYMDDISSNNIIYDKENLKLSILDFDNYRYIGIDNNALYTRNMSETLETIIFSFIMTYKNNGIGDFSKRMVEEGVSIKDALYYVKSYIENIIEKKIDTVGELKENSSLLLKLK